MLKFEIFKWELVGIKYWEGKKFKTFIFRPLSTTVLLVICDAEMRIFICIKSVKVRYICPANQQFFCDDENPFFYGSIKKSYLVPHGRTKLMICPQDYDDYHHKKHNGIKSNLKLNMKYHSLPLKSRCNNFSGTLFLIT